MSWRSASRAGMFSTHPPPHRLDVADEAVALGDLPHHRRDEVDEVLPQLEVAGHRTCLEQRLELPGLGPPLVVRAMAGQGAHQGAGLALGAQVGVDRPDRALHGVLGADLHELGRELGGDPRCRALVDVPGGLGRLEDEEHVDVGDVVELVAAALAQRDDAQSRRLRSGHAGPRDRQRSVERAGGQVGQLGRGVVDPEVVSEVAGREAGQDAPVLHPQRVGRLGRRQGGRRLRALGIGAHRLEQRPPHRRTPGGGWSRGTGRPARATARGAGTGGRPGPGWHRGPRAAASRCPRRRPARGRARGPPARRQPSQPTERLVGVGGAGQDRDERLRPLPQRPRARRRRARCPGSRAG